MYWRQHHEQGQIWAFTQYQQQQSTGHRILLFADSNEPLLHVEHHQTSSFHPRGQLRTSIVLPYEGWGKDWRQTADKQTVRIPFDMGEGPTKTTVQRRQYHAASGQYGLMLQTDAAFMTVDKSLAERFTRICVQLGVQLPGYVLRQDPAVATEASPLDELLWKTRR